MHIAAITLQRGRLEGSGDQTMEVGWMSHVLGFQADSVQSPHAGPSAGPLSYDMVNFDKTKSTVLRRILGQHIHQFLRLDNDVVSL